eukprot:ANDGO_02947.mRNA.1 WD repeat-containing protein pop2
MAHFVDASYLFIRREHAHLDSCNCIAVDATHVLLATGGGDNVIRLWSASSDVPVMECRGHTGFLTSLCLGRDHVVSGSHDQTVRRFDLQQGKCASVLRVHDDCVSQALIQRTMLVSCGMDHRVVVSDWRTGEPAIVFDGSENKFTCFDVHDEQIAMGGLNRAVQIFDIRFHRSPHTVFADHGAQVSCIRFGTRRGATNGWLAAAPDHLLSADPNYIPSEASRLLFSGDLSGSVYTWALGEPSSALETSVLNSLPSQSESRPTHRPSVFRIPLAKVCIANGAGISKLQVAEDGCLIAATFSGVCQVSVPLKANKPVYSYVANCPVLDVVQAQETLITAHADGQVYEWKYQNALQTRLEAIRERKEEIRKSLLHDVFLAERSLQRDLLSSQAVSSESPHQSPEKEQEGILRVARPQVTVRPRSAVTTASDDLSAVETLSNSGISASSLVSSPVILAPAAPRPVRTPASTSGFFWKPPSPDRTHHAAPAAVFSERGVRPSLVAVGRSPCLQEGIPPYSRPLAPRRSLFPGLEIKSLPLSVRQADRRLAATARFSASKVPCASWELISSREASVAANPRPATAPQGALRK